jgi:hypothetical protein
MPFGVAEDFVDCVLAQWEDIQTVTETEEPLETSD